MSGRFNIIKQFFTKSGDGKVIRSVKPNVPKTKLEKATSNLDKAIQRNKASRAKLGQTIFESKNKAFKGKDDFTFTKTNKKTESNKEAYKRIQGENTKVLKGMIDDAFKDKKKKTKMAMSEAQLMHATKMAQGEEQYQGKLLEARQSDWKDEAVLIILSLPVLVLAWAVISDDPTAMDKVKLFFDMFSQLPSWFTNLWILVVASIYGIKGTQIFRNGGKK